MDNLTYMQRIALRGEIGKLVATYNKHDADIPFMCFLCLIIYEDNLISTVKELLCSFVDKDIVERVSYYTQSCIVPYDIWSEKIISDIKWLTDDTRSEEEENILRSIFCNYINKIKDTSLYATHYLLNKVLHDEELSLLHKDAFYLRCNIPQPVNVKQNDDSASSSADIYKKECGIFTVSFMRTDPLSFEDASEGFMSNVPEEINEEVKGDNNAELFNNLRESFKNVDDNTYFLVEKREIDTGDRVSIRRFVDIEEVINYLENVATLSEEEQESYQFTVLEAVENEI